MMVEEVKTEKAGEVRSTTRLTVNNNQLINIRQQGYYLINDELRCHNLCSKYPLFSLAQMWIFISHPQRSVAVIAYHLASLLVIELNLVYE